jgi:hypothetical protein
VASARNSIDDFHRTTKEIAEYMSREHKEAGEFIEALNPSKLTGLDEMSRQCALTITSEARADIVVVAIAHHFHST